MFAFDLGKDGDDFLLHTQGDPEDDDVTQVDDIIVTGTQPPSGGGTYGGGGGHGQPGEVGDEFIDDGGGGLEDDCPWNEALSQLSEQLGHFKDGVAFLKDSWLVLDPRDDRAMEGLIFSLESIEQGLRYGTVDFTTVHDTISSVIGLALSEGTAYLGTVFSAALGTAIFAGADGPAPFGELVGVIGGAVVGVVADRTLNPVIADALASLILANVRIPEDMEGPCSNA